MSKDYFSDPFFNGIIITAIVSSLLLGYLYVPHIVEIGGENSSFLWTSPISEEQALTGFWLVVGMGVVVNLVYFVHSIFRHTKAGISTGILGLLAVIGLGMVMVVSSAVIMIVMFEVSFSALTSFGIESSIAGAIGVVTALLAAKYISR